MLERPQDSALGANRARHSSDKEWTGVGSWDGAGLGWPVGRVQGPQRLGGGPGPGARTTSFSMSTELLESAHPSLVAQDPDAPVLLGGLSGGPSDPGPASSFTTSARSSARIWWMSWSVKTPQTSAISSIALTGAGATIPYAHEVEVAISRADYLAALAFFGIGVTGTEMPGVVGYAVTEETTDGDLPTDCLGRRVDTCFNIPAKGVHHADAVFAEDAQPTT